MITNAQYMAIIADLAMRVVGAIHHDGPGAASDVLESIYAVPQPAGITASRALITVLAAMVDPTKTKHELLDWVCLPPQQQLARLAELERAA